MSIVSCHYTSLTNRNQSKLWCLTAGLGSSLYRDMHGRGLVHAGTGHTHQLPWTISGHTGSKNLHKNISAISTWQCHSSGVHQQHVGHSIKPTDGTTKDQWMRTLDRDISLLVQHIPGVSNTIAGRMIHNRMFCLCTFQTIKKTFRPLDVDLFASRLMYQLTRFFSCWLDPLAEAVDAFQQEWSPLKGFANPPCCLIRMPASSSSTSVKGVPSTSGDVVRLTQVDYPSFRLNSEANRLPNGDGPSVSHDNCLQKRFSSSSLSKRPLCYMYNCEESSQPSLITHTSKSGLSGVVRGVAIPFLDLPLMQQAFWQNYTVRATRSSLNSFTTRWVVLH